MRTFVIFCLLHGTLACAQVGPLINELQASNHGTIVDPTGGTPDWIEIYNPAQRTIDLHGMRFAINGRQHVVEGSVKIAPKGYHVLWFDANPRKGPDHIGFRLPREGGSLLLISAEGRTILDVFTWPELGANESIGRSKDGLRSWAYFNEPTPGRSNNTAHGHSLHTPAVLANRISGRTQVPFDLELNAGTTQIYYTTDGSTPGPQNGTLYHHPIPIDRNATIHARAFSAEGIGGKVYIGNFLFDVEDDPISIITDPAHLVSDSTGIDTDGVFSNHSRSGKDWERPAYLEMDDRITPVGLRIHGSGSRSLPKRSFKVYERHAYGGSGKNMRFDDGKMVFDEGILRADAGAHAFLRNMVMGTIAGHASVDIEVQISSPHPLYINGEYHGLYRWMPPKDAQWLRHMTGATSVDILDGPAHVPLAGKDDHYLKGLNLLLDGSPTDSIGHYFDLGSLIDLACLDLFTGRADHDLNVRCYRERANGGLWRWILFDMDIWAPVNDHSLGRMSTAIVPETPYLPYLLKHPEIRKMFLARFAAMNATLLAPPRAIAIADSIHNGSKDALQKDHEHWKSRMDRPSPERSLEEMKEFLAKRGTIVMEQLARHTGSDLERVLVDVPDPSIGHMHLNGLPLSAGKQEILLFSDINMVIEITMAPNVELIGWKGAEGAMNTIELIPGRMRHLRPRTATTGASGGNGLQ